MMSAGKETKKCIVARPSTLRVLEPRCDKVVTDVRLLWDNIGTISAIVDHFGLCFFSGILSWS